MNNPHFCQVDPFLRLVEDCKLQAIDIAAEHLTRIYGSKEDDTAALESLSAITVKEDLSKQSMVSEIVNSLEDLPDVNASLIFINLFSINYKFSPYISVMSSSVLLSTVSFLSLF